MGQSINSIKTRTLGGTCERETKRAAEAEYEIPVQDVCVGDGKARRQYGSLSELRWRDGSAPMTALIIVSIATASINVAIMFRSFYVLNRIEQYKASLKKLVDSFEILPK